MPHQVLTLAYSSGTHPEPRRTALPTDRPREAVLQLLRVLASRAWTPADGPLAPALTTCWVSRADAGRYRLIVPAMYGPLDFMRLVNTSTVDQALVLGLIALEEPMPMPIYNYGGYRHRWCTIQQGQPIGLTALASVLMTSRIGADQ